MYSCCSLMCSDHEFALWPCSLPSVPSDLPSDGPYAGDSDPSVHGTRQGPNEQSCGAGGLGGGRGARPVRLLQKGPYCCVCQRTMTFLSPNAGAKWCERCLVSSAGPGEGEETLKTREGVWFGGGRGRGVVHSALTENCKEEVDTSTSTPHLPVYRAINSRYLKWLNRIF